MLSVILAILAIVIWVFFGAIKFLVTFAIFADLNTRFLQAILLNLFFLKLRQKFVAKFCYSLQSLMNLLFLLYLLYFYTFLTVHLIFFAKIAKKICYQNLATVFNPGHKWRARR